MGLHLTDRGYGKELVYSIQATAYIDRETVEGLTTEQLARLEHHVTEVSRSDFRGQRRRHGEGCAKVRAGAWAGRLGQERILPGRRPCDAFLVPAHIQRGGGLCQSNRSIRRCPGGGTVSTVGQLACEMGVHLIGRWSFENGVWAYRCGKCGTTFRREPCQTDN